MMGFVGMDKQGRLHLLLDGLMSGRQHGADPPLRFADGAATEPQTKVLFQLLLYLADALMKLPALQGDVTEQVRPHLGATNRLGQRHHRRVDALGADGTKQLMLGDEVAHLGQVKHLMHPIRLVMGQHLATTAGTIRWRVVRHHGQAGIVRMAFPPLTIVTRLGPALFTGSRTRPSRWRAAGSVTGG